MSVGMSGKENEIMKSDHVVNDEVIWNLSSAAVYKTTINVQLSKLQVYSDVPTRVWPDYFDLASCFIQVFTSNHCLVLQGSLYYSVILSDAGRTSR